MMMSWREILKEFKITRNFKMIKAKRAGKGRRIKITRPIINAQKLTTQSNIIIFWHGEGGS